MSVFKDDQSAEAQKHMIGDIRRAIECGDTCFLMYTEPIHGSLYDLFNQFFTVQRDRDQNAKLYVQIGIGSYSKASIDTTDAWYLSHQLSPLASFPPVLGSSAWLFSIILTAFVALHLFSQCITHKNYLGYGQQKCLQTVLTIDLCVVECSHVWCTLRRVLWYTRQPSCCIPSRRPSLTGMLQGCLASAPYVEVANPASSEGTTLTLLLCASLLQLLHCPSGLLK